MHGIWTPGVRIMRMVRFKTKAAAISLLFFIPIAILTHQFVSTEQDKIAFSEAELVGMSYLKTVVPLVGEMQTVRKLALQGAAAGSEQAGLREARAAVGTTLQKIQVAENQWGAQLGTGKAFSDLKAAISKAD